MLSIAQNLPIRSGETIAENRLRQSETFKPLEDYRARPQYTGNDGKIYSM